MCILTSDNGKNMKVVNLSKSAGCGKHKMVSGANGRKVFGN